MNRISALLIASAAVLHAVPAESLSAPQEAQLLGDTGHQTPVHKKDSEGSIMIDSFTGRVTTPVDELPEWAYGLAMAQLAERHAFYNTRLGAAYATEHSQPELFAFEDLAWLGVTLNDGQLSADGTPLEAGDEFELPADAEHRMEVLATVLGIEREPSEMGRDGDIEGTMVEVHIASDNTRTDAEMEDFRQGQEEGFKEAQG